MSTLTFARRTRFHLPLFVLFVASWPIPSPAQPKVPSPDPEAERRSFKIADGFDVSLWAADPDVTKPIQMAWDHRGRLWVCSSSIYPQIKPGQPVNDRILVLEDTDGDGKADKSTVFADGLLIPTGMALGDGGAYVANSTEILHLRDTNGDGKADSRRTVLSGFGTEDTHHLIHTFRWGPDGRLYFNQSVYIHSHVETPWGTVRLLGGGVWRFHPQDLRLEVFCRGLINGWGHCWDEFGQSFGTDGAGGEGIYYMLPGALLTPLGNTSNQPVLHGLNPGSPKYAGLERISGRAMPDDWQGDLITNDFRAHRVCRFKLTESGAGYVSRQLPDLITSTDVAFRPIDVKMGPDGALYIADWYNPIINHGEVDFRDPRRDHTHGRIWRVTAKAKKTLDRPKIEGATIAQLLDALKSPEDWTRLHAKLALRERDSREVSPALAEWVKSLGDAAESDHHRLEALWTYETIDVAEPALLRRVLSSADGRIRAAAVRVLSHWAPQITGAFDLLSDLATDDHPRTRMEAVRALAELHRPESIVAATKALDKPTDPFLDYALSLTASQLQDVWLPALENGTLKQWADANPKQVTFALRAANSPESMKLLMAMLKAGKVPPDSLGDVLDLVATAGGPAEAANLLDMALSPSADPALRGRVLGALESAARTKNIKPAGDLARLKPLIAEGDPATRTAAVRLAGLWKAAELRDELASVATAPDAPLAVRRAAIDALAQIGGPQARKSLHDLAASDTQPPAVRERAVSALATLDAKSAAALAAELITADRAPVDPASILPAFLTREVGAAALAKALSSSPRKLAPDQAKLALRAVQTSGRDAPDLINFLRQAAGITGEPPPPMTPEQMKQTITDVLAKGDPARGELVFRSAALQCYQCHAIAGAGGQLGPDLRSIGASAPLDYIVESILYPNKAVKDEYHALLVTTSDGNQYTGIKLREDATTLVLRDNLHDEIPIPVSTIKRRKDIGSLMPAGLADPLTRQEFLDLVRFLSELGKPGPYAASDTQVVRRWRIHPNVSTVQAPVNPNLPWTPAYSMADGTLPLDAMEGDKPQPRPAARPAKAKKKANGQSPMSFVQFQLNVTAPGKIKLAINSPVGLYLYVDETGTDLQHANDITPQLTAGPHTITFRVDLGQRTEGLRVEITDAPRSTAHAQPVGGK